MWTSRFASPVVCLLVLLSSTVGLVGHDHVTETLLGGDLAGVECAADHHAESGGARAESPEVVASGKPHHHQCVACHFGGQRLLLARAQAGTVYVSPDAGSSLEATSAPRTNRSWTGRTLRGPPLA
ncbi:MAG: DUF2946 family protein [Acidobacteriota bacterium]